MAIRFMDSGFYKSPFVRSLKGPLKALYSFIICDCHGSGIWVKDLPIASAYIGFEVVDNDFQVFIDSGKAVDLKNGKYFFPDFIEHQYPTGLQEKNPAHKNFILELKKYNLIDGTLKVLPRPFEGSQVIVTVIDKVKVKVKEKEKVTERVTVEVYPVFEDFWQAYDKKIDRRACERKWAKIKQADRYSIMLHVPAYVDATPEKKYRMNPETYLNNESWHNEIIRDNGQSTAKDRNGNPIDARAYIEAAYMPPGDDTDAGGTM